jgi:hypothetical protein
MVDAVRPTDASSRAASREWQAIFVEGLVIKVEPDEERRRQPQAPVWPIFGMAALGLLFALLLIAAR